MISDFLLQLLEARVAVLVLCFVKKTYMRVQALESAI